MNKENKFSIQCFNCQKQYQYDAIPRRCKYCQSGNIEVKESGGSIVDMPNSVRINWEMCSECGKGCRVWSPDDALPEELEAKKQQLKNEDRWCEGNCQQQDIQSQQSHSTQNNSNNTQLTSTERERERERAMATNLIYLEF